MITKEIREWMDKVKRRQYSFEDAMTEFSKFTSFLTREEMRLIKSKIEETYL